MTKEGLIRELVESGCLRTPEIVEAMRAVDRRDFVPKEYERECYENYPLPIGFGQTISQPFTVAFMLELLRPQFGERILEVGAGSGWQAALLGYLVSREPKENGKKRRNRRAGKVYAVERIQALFEVAKKNVARYDFIKRGIVEVVLGDGSLGYPKGAPFHKIITAASADRMQVSWKEQLQVGGKIVAPVGTTIRVLEKFSSSDWNEERYDGFSFVPLVTQSGGSGQ